MRAAPRFLVSLVPLVLLLACVPDSDQPVVGLQAHSFANSEWSAPLNLGAPINTAFAEQGPELSIDGLTLYFSSNRPGGSGGFDMWVSRRGCSDCAWEEPFNLGPLINGSGNEGGPSLSNDGHLLFFGSNRLVEGADFLNDIYVSRRADPKDDSGWGVPVRLGPDVNTAAAEAGAEYLQSAEDGPGNLYFGRGPAANFQDIYVAPVTQDGETLGPAALVEELSDPTTHEAIPRVRTDAREIVFWSNRPGGLGGGDLWMSTRRSVHDAWSAPVNLGALVNAPALDFQPSLSFDARTLLFASNRSGSLSGSLDIWMSTRTPSGH
jgi:hypothetical protein